MDVIECFLIMYDDTKIFFTSLSRISALQVVVTIPDAYNYLQSRLCEEDSGVVVGPVNIRLPKSLEYPSQRSPDNANHCWLAVERWKTTMYVHCTQAWKQLDGM